MSKGWHIGRTLAESESENKKGPSRGITISDECVYDRKKQRRRRWPIIATARRFRFRFRETAIPLGIIFLFRVEKFGLHVASQFPRQPRSRLNAATEPDELKNRDYANKNFLLIL